MNIKLQKYLHNTFGVPSPVLTGNLTKTKANLLKQILFERIEREYAWNIERCAGMVSVCEVGVLITELYKRINIPVTVYCDDYRITFQLNAGETGTMNSPGGLDEISNLFKSLFVGCSFQADRDSAWLEKYGAWFIDLHELFGVPLYTLSGGGNHIKREYGFRLYERYFPKLQSREKC